MNEIAGKCTFKLSDLQNVVSSGVKYVEFHTFKEDFDSVNFKTEMYKIREFLDHNDIICHAIHAPIVSSEGMPERYCWGNLYEDSSSDFFAIITKLVYAAEILCKTKNPIIVTHIGTCYYLDDSKRNNLSKNTIDSVIDDMKRELRVIDKFLDEIHSDAIIVIENMPIFDIGKRGIVGHYFGQKDELPKLVEELNLPHIKTCLDVCHTLCSIKVNNLYNPYEKITLKNYLEYYKNTVVLIHLNNLIDFGEVTSKHSQPFSDNYDDIEFLFYFFRWLEEFDITCPITLEINENNYSNRFNLIESIKTLDKVLNNY